MSTAHTAAATESVGVGEAFTADPGSVEMLTSMGFTPPQAMGALKATEGNIERAADWSVPLPSPVCFDLG